MWIGLLDLLVFQLLLFKASAFWILVFGFFSPFFFISQALDIGFGFSPSSLLKA